MGQRRSRGHCENHDVWEDLSDVAGASNNLRMAKASSDPVGFASAVPAWQARLGLVRDVVRQELVHRQLTTHLPDPASGAPVRVLDVGCGQGTQLVRLAHSGYEVVGLDPSDELLDMASKALKSEDHEVRSRVQLRQGGIGEWRRAGSDFDVVCCHGVVMYLPSLAEAVRELVAACRPGGLISLLSKNRNNLALRAALAGDWEGAVTAFDRRSYTNRLGVEGARSDDPEEVVAALSVAGAEPVAWYGVRLFTDHWGDVEAPAEIEIILEAEAEAGRRDPFRRLAALSHVIARRGHRHE
jgi:S-adenosylmethionine-dependent methyltransferase